jgi:prophage regulatory protein
MNTTGSKPYQKLINRKTLLAMIPLSDRVIFNMEKRGDFPSRIVLTSRNVAWDLSEIENWIEARKSSSDQARRPGFIRASASTGSSSI